MFKPEERSQERVWLLAELETQALLSEGTLRLVLEKLQAVLLSRRQGAPFQPQLAEEFAQALESYKRDPSAPPPPDILGECLNSLREHVVAMLDNSRG
jgi:hypothetical protein